MLYLPESLGSSPSLRISFGVDGTLKRIGTFFAHSNPVLYLMFYRFVDPEEIYNQVCVALSINTLFIGYTVQTVLTDNICTSFY